jgi:ABC-type phosphate/phosphonate transport system permease subunit
MSIFIVIFIILLSAYAFIFEKNESSDAFIKGIPDKKDSINKLYKKLEWCATYETRTVKWRRTLLSTVFIIILLFGFIHNKFPNTREVVLYMVFIFGTIYISGSLYTQQISMKVNDMCKNCIKFIKDNSKNNYL